MCETSDRDIEGKLLLLDNRPLTNAERTARWRQRHPDRYLSSAKRSRPLNVKRRLQLKLEVLTHYGSGKCACIRCGFPDIRALSIDHISGGGNSQRRDKLKASERFYSWLKKQTYPAGYQTLCMNCQFVKRFENGEHNSNSYHKTESIQ